ncbi:MAG: hypothetical protein AAGA18_10190 [Verrucomicrobiota bacterium]
MPSQTIEDPIDLKQIINPINEYSEGLAVLSDILRSREWFCAYYCGYNKKSLIRLLTEAPLTHLNVLSKVETSTNFEDEIPSRDKEWNQKIHYWRAGGLVDSEIFIADYPWSRDGQLKDILRESVPRVVFLLGEAATQTEQRRYSWRRGKDFNVGLLKPIYEASVNTGDRFRLLLS